MRVSDFDFELPPEHIALRPVRPRDASKLLVVDNGDLSDRTFTEIGDYLRPGDVLVVNDTRVIPARLEGRRAVDGHRGEARIEATLHKQVDAVTWRALVRPARKCRLGDSIDFNGLRATVVEKGEAGEITLCFDTDAERFAGELASHGAMPLPPYIAKKRPPDARDLSDYQTVFAAKDGAVAAPTAGLHFTPELLARLGQAGVARETLTLHVGAGTFLPIKTEDTTGHKMHSEWGEISAETADRLNVARSGGGRIVAVGTTALRLLESAAREGDGEDGGIQPFSGETDIFITPGYRFRAVDLLITNFHLPRSTLFMLVAAFAGHDVMASAYGHAIDRGFRFYSYGDACLLFPGREQ